MEYLLGASVMSAPAALIAAKITMPVRDKIVDDEDFKLNKIT